MLKISCVLALMLLIIPIQGSASPNKAKQGKGGKEPAHQASSTAPIQPGSASDRAVSENHAPYEVIVVSTPPKDHWDKAAVVVNIVLAAIGFVGIGIGIFTLIKLERQTSATENSIKLQEKGYLQWVDLVNWRTEYIPTIGSQPAFLKVQADVVNPTSFPLTIKDGFIKFGGSTTYYFMEEFFVTPNNPYTVDLSIFLPADHELSFLTTGMWYSVRAELPHAGILGNTQQQSIWGHLTCINGKAATWVPEMPEKDTPQ